MMGGIRTRIDLFSAAAAVAFEGFQLYMYREREIGRENDTRGEAVSRLAVAKN